MQNSENTQSVDNRRRPASAETSIPKRVRGGQDSEQATAPSKSDVSEKLDDSFKENEAPPLPPPARKTLLDDVPDETPILDYLKRQGYEEMEWAEKTLAEIELRTIGQWRKYTSLTEWRILLVSQDLSAIRNRMKMENVIVRTGDRETFCKLRHIEQDPLSVNAIFAALRIRNLPHRFFDVRCVAGENTYWKLTFRASVLREAHSAAMRAQLPLLLPELGTPLQKCSLYDNGIKLLRLKADHSPASLKELHDSDWIDSSLTVFDQDTNAWTEIGKNPYDMTGTPLDKGSQFRQDLLHGEMFKQMKFAYERIHMGSDDSCGALCHDLRQKLGLRVDDAENFLSKMMAEEKKQRAARRAGAAGARTRAATVRTTATLVGMPQATPSRPPHVNTTQIPWYALRLFFGQVHRLGDNFAEIERNERNFELHVLSPMYVVLGAYTDVLHSAHKVESAVVYGVGEKLDIGTRPEANNYVPDASVVTGLVEAQADGEFPHQDEDRIKATVCSLLQWQTLTRAKKLPPSGEKAGVHFVLAAGTHVSVYWAGFLPLRDQPPAAAIDTDPVGHFCALELCKCNLTTADGILMFARLMYLISLDTLHLKMPKHAAERVQDPLMGMLKEVFKMKAAASVTPEYGKPHRSSSTDAGDAGAAAVPARELHAAVQEALCVAVDEAVINTTAAETLSCHRRGPSVIRMGDEVVKIDLRSRHELDALQLLAQAAVPHVLLPLRTYPNVPAGGSTLVFKYHQPCPRKLSLSEFAQFAYPLLQALAGMHAMGVVHGDVKPANIVCDQAGHPMLIDFNCTCKAGFKGAVGTKSWMAPELLTEAPVMLPASDIFSLGCVLASLLFGNESMQDIDNAERVKWARNKCHRLSIGLSHHQRSLVDAVANMLLKMLGPQETRPDANRLLQAPIFDPLRPAAQPVMSPPTQPSAVPRPAAHQALTAKPARPTPFTVYCDPDLQAAASAVSSTAVACAATTASKPRRPGKRTRGTAIALRTLQGENGSLLH